MGHAFPLLSPLPPCLKLAKLSPLDIPHYFAATLTRASALRHMPSTIERCLARLGLAIASLAGCDDLDAEWAAVKRAYFKTVLKTHPDKGGDASAFRKVQGAFDPNPNPNPNPNPEPEP